MEQTLIALAITFGTAYLIRFLHYIIGSPKIDPDTHEINVNKDAIFSILGRFVANMYIQSETKETRRIWAKYAKWKECRIAEHEKLMNESDPSKHAEIVQQLATDLESVQNNIDSWRRPNPWMAAGLCPICFGTWVSLVSWLFATIAFGINPGFIIFGIASSVLISNRIKL